ncbi:MAG: hypothetical protein LBQ59_01315 [Candidatus Peribacteria bacterium]|jgi:hypothetical protein|nr:hypothetical protein [Candidatus Peribacteria bacterium]
MYKDNFMERDDGKRIDNQDFAQIFAQLAGSAKFAEMDVQDIKEQIKD